MAKKRVVWKYGHGCCAAMDTNPTLLVEARRWLAAVVADQDT